MLKVVLAILYNCISENPKRPANRCGVGRVNPLAIRTWRLVSRGDKVADGQFGRPSNLHFYAEGRTESTLTPFSLRTYVPTYLSLIDLGRAEIGASSVCSRVSTILTKRPARRHCRWIILDYTSSYSYTSSSSFRKRKRKRRLHPQATRLKFLFILHQSPRRPRR